MTIKTFRGLMQADTQDTIVLHTNDGSVGYKIVKFEIMPYNFNVNSELTIQIWKVSQSSYSTLVDFSDQTLLGAAFTETVGGTAPGHTTSVIFDNEIFNQDIYVTLQGQTLEACNYYIELEQMKLDLSENTVATLKDIRNVTTPT